MKNKYNEIHCAVTNNSIIFRGNYFSNEIYWKIVKSFKPIEDITSSTRRTVFKDNDVKYFIII